MTNKPEFELLSYDDLTQRQKWRNILDSFENIDIFFFPEYLKLFELHGDGKPYLFVYGDFASGYVIYPFLKRPIPESSAQQKGAESLFDITSPYGYTGYLRNRDSINMEAFYSCFNKFCIDNGIVSEFIRFHPLLNNVSYSPKKVNILQERETVVIDLDNKIDVILSEMQPNCRNKIKKAINNNVTIIQDDDFINIDLFYELYINTMYRLKANKYYFFAKKWFHAFIDLMKKNTALFHAYHDGKIVNSALFIFNNVYIHYFLSGSLFEMRKLAANNLLIYEVALWAKAIGIKYFHLGGGYQPNDSLSYFKSSFSSHTKKFCIGGVIHQSTFYEYLCNLKMKSGPIHQDSNFFPLYRVPQG